MLWLQCKGATYSAVVIATPLELTNIEFEGLDLPHLPARKYQSTISTFVRGHLKGSYFGQQKAPQGKGLQHAASAPAWS